MGAAPWLMQQGVQLVCLGSGSPALEDGLRWLEFTYKCAALGCCPACYVLLLFEAVGCWHAG
jgi:glycogen synthase